MTITDPVARSTPTVSADVLAAAKRGDQSAWRRIVGEHEADLLNFAARRGAPEPHDVVQDVFATAAHKLSSFDGSPQQFRSWLFTVAYRRVADAHRVVYGSREVLSGDIPDQVIHGSTPEDAVEDAESLSEAIAALAVLSTREREVLLARVIEDRSSADVAALFDLSIINVRVIQSRALSKVRAHLRSVASAKSCNGAALSTIALGVMAFTDRAHALTGSLPSDPLMSEWIAALRADAVAQFGAAPTAAQVSALVEVSAANLAAGGAVASGASAGASVFTSSVSSALGSVVSAVVLSAAAIGGLVVLDDTPPAVHSEGGQSIGAPALAGVDDPALSWASRIVSSAVSNGAAVTVTIDEQVSGLLPEAIEIPAIVGPVDIDDAGTTVESVGAAVSLPQVTVSPLDALPTPPPLPEPTVAPLGIRGP